MKTEKEIELEHLLSPFIPDTKEKFELLPTLSKKLLRTLGMVSWDDNLLLYPLKWYSFIPEGTTIIDINGITKKFKVGITDDDSRFGALAFGFKKE